MGAYGGNEAETNTFGFFYQYDQQINRLLGHQRTLEEDIKKYQKWLLSYRKAIKKLDTKLTKSLPNDERKRLQDLRSSRIDMVQKLEAQIREHQNEIAELIALRDSLQTAADTSRMLP